MKLDYWKRLWEKDGFKLSEQDVREKGHFKWVLYSVNAPYSAEDYGRHFAILMLIDKETGQVLAHDQTNVGGDFPDNPVNVSQETKQWFERHVNEEDPTKYLRS